MLEVISELLLQSVVPRLVANRLDVGIHHALVGLRNQIWKPTPENHNLQGTLLRALRDGVETTTRRGLKSLSELDQQRVEQWLNRQTQTINREIDALQWGKRPSLETTEAWGMLLRATPEELDAMGQRQINGQLRQMKATMERRFQVETLPPSFREEFEAEWLPWVSLYLAEAIKTNPQVAEILQVNLLMDIQLEVRQLIEALSNPQDFLGAVQLIDFNVKELRAELANWQKDLQGQIGSGFEDTQRQMEDMNQQLQEQLDQVLAVLGRMQKAVPKSGSTNVITVPPNVDHWLGRETEIAQILAWMADPAVDIVGVHGLGGVGKSALVARIFDQTEGFVAKFWADVSQKPSFDAFAEQALNTLGGYSLGQLIQLDATELTNHLLTTLNQRRCLLVIDNLETLLDESRHWVDSSYGQFFDRWAAQGKTSLLVMTTQEKPVLFQAKPCWLGLQGITATTGGKLLQELGIQGELSDLEAFAAAVDGHPLTLYLVAGFLREYCEAQLSRASELGLTEFDQLADAAVGSHRSQREVRRAWILQQHLDRLSPELHDVLVRLSVYRQPFDRNAAAFMLGQGNETADPLLTQWWLQELLNRSLLSQPEAGRYQFLPFVMAYLSQQIPDPATAHQRAIAYYQSIAQPESKWKTLPDIAPHLEMVYHYLAQGALDQAYDTLMLLERFLTWGHQTLRAELCGQLLAAFDRRPAPSPADQEKMGWLLSGLSAVTRSQGQFKSALLYSERLLAISHTLGNQQLEARALLGLGNVYTSLSQHTEATEYLEHALAIAREIGSRAEEGYALGSLGDVHQSFSEYGKAIEYYEQQLIIAREIGDRTEEEVAMWNLGRSYDSLSQDAKAIECYEEVLIIIRDTSHHHKTLPVVYFLSNIYWRLSQYDKAIEHYKQSFLVTRDIGDRFAEQIALSYLLTAYENLGQNDKAIKYLKQQLTIVRKTGNRQSEGLILGALGVAYKKLRQYAKAIEYYEQCLTIAREMGDRAREGRTLGRAGDAYQHLCQYAKALECYEQQLIIVRKTGDRQSEGLILGALGVAYKKLRQYAKAIECYEQCLTIAREMGDRAREGRTLGLAGDAYQGLGQYAKALECCEQSLTVAREMGDLSFEEMALGCMGNAYQGLGQYAKAIECYEQQLTIVREMGDRAGEGKTLGLAGDAYQCLDQYAKAIECYEQSLTVAREMGDLSFEEMALGSMGNAYHRLGRYAKAIECYEQQLTIVREMGDRSGEGNILCSLGNAYQHLSQYAKAIECYEQQLTIAREIWDRQSEQVALYNLGNTFDALGQHQIAFTYYQPALQLARELQKATSPAHTHFVQGITQNKRENFALALEHYQQAQSLYEQGNFALALDHYRQAKTLYSRTEGNATWANKCEEWIQHIQKRLS